jgi:hypothetical protein
LVVSAIPEALVLNCVCGDEGVKVSLCRFL